MDSEGYEGLSGFRYALRRFLSASETISHAAGVTQQQYQALLAIKTWAGQTMTMRDLADQLLLTHHAAVQLVDRLARADLAVRRPSLDDGRSVVLSLSAKGQAILDELGARHLAEIMRQEPLLTRSLARLRRMKPRLQQDLEKG